MPERRPADGGRPWLCSSSTRANSTTKAAEAARNSTALANETRLAILCELVEGERSVGTLVDAVGLTQSALSQHLAKLRAAGIVATRRDAQTIYYRLASTPPASVMATLAEIYCGRRRAKFHTKPEKNNADQINDAVTLKKRLDEGSAVLIDVREPNEHAREHIEGARLVPLSRFRRKTSAGFATRPRCSIATAADAPARMRSS